MKLKKQFSFLFAIFVAFPILFVLITIGDLYGQAWAGGGCGLGVLCAEALISYYVFFICWFAGIILFIIAKSAKMLLGSLICFLFVFSAPFLDDVQIWATQKTLDLSIETQQCSLNNIMPGQVAQFASLKSIPTPFKRRNTCYNALSNCDKIRHDYLLKSNCIAQKTGQEVVRYDNTQVIDAEGCRHQYRAHSSRLRCKMFFADNDGTLFDYCLSLSDETSFNHGNRWSEFSKSERGFCYDYYWTGTENGTQYKLCSRNKNCDLRGFSCENSDEWSESYCNFKKALDLFDGQFCDGVDDKELSRHCATITRAKIESVLSSYTQTLERRLKEARQKGFCPPYLGRFDDGTVGYVRLPKEECDLLEQKHTDIIIRQFGKSVQNKIVDPSQCEVVSDPKSRALCLGFFEIEL